MLFKPELDYDERYRRQRLDADLWWQEQIDKLPMPNLDNWQEIEDYSRTFAELEYQHRLRCVPPPPCEPSYDTFVESYGDEPVWVDRIFALVMLVVITAFVIWFVRSLTGG